MNEFRAYLWLPAAALMLAAGASAHAGAVVGRVILAAGDVVAIRDGKEIRLAFSTAIEEGDTLRAGSASNFQVRFADDSILSLRELSEVRVDEFRFTGTADGTERGFFSLLKGGLRKVTGIIGRIANQNYRLSTPTSTIGIRGTDYAARDCRGDCRNPDGTLVKDGLYGSVLGASSGTNRVSITNDAGERVFGTSEHFYVADLNTLPQPLLEPPAFVASRLEGRGKTDEKKEAGGTEQAISGGIQAESRPSASPEPLPRLAFVTTENLAAGGTSAVLPPPNFPAQGVGGIAYFPSSFSSGFGFSNATLTDNGSNQLRSFAVTSPFTISGNVGAASILDSGSDLGAGNLHWGRWFGTGATINSVFGPAFVNSNLHYIVGDSPTLPSSGQFTYKPVGGTNPTNAAGVTGIFRDGLITVDFLPRLLTVNSLKFDFNNSSYS